jgi:hypothetical protein
MANSLKNQRGYVVEVQGFSSGRGGAAIENSRQMAQAVVRYLVLNHEVPVYRIYTVGMGNAPIKAEGKAVRTRGGRVEISLLKNGLGDLASGAPVSTDMPAPATNVTPASQEPQGNTGATTDKPSPSAPSKPPNR